MVASYISPFHARMLAQCTTSLLFLVTTCSVRIPFQLAESITAKPPIIDHKMDQTCHSDNIRHCQSSTHFALRLAEVSEPRHMYAYFLPKDIRRDPELNHKPRPHMLQTMTMFIAFIESLPFIIDFLNYS